MPLTTILNSNVPCIRLTGDIDMPVCFALVDEIRLLRNYYQFRTIELQIDSPGGCVDGLQYVVHSTKEWRTGKGLVLRTVALNEVCSAAMLLSFGTVGHRQAMKSCRLLYHPVRTVFRQNTARTVSELRWESKQLEIWDSMFLDMVTEHACRDVQERPAYRRKLKRLFRQERIVQPAEAREYRLIDTVVM